MADRICALLLLLLLRNFFSLPAIVRTTEAFIFTDTRDIWSRSLPATAPANPIITHCPPEALARRPRMPVEGDSGTPQWANCCAWSSLQAEGLSSADRQTKYRPIHADDHINQSLLLLCEFTAKQSAEQPWETTCVLPSRIVDCYPEAFMQRTIGSVNSVWRASSSRNLLAQGERHREVLICTFVRP